MGLDLLESRIESRALRMYHLLLLRLLALFVGLLEVALHVLAHETVLKGDGVGFNQADEALVLGDGAGLHWRVYGLEFGLWAFKFAEKWGGIAVEGVGGQIGNS